VLRLPTSEAPGGGPDTTPRPELQRNRRASLRFAMSGPSGASQSPHLQIAPRRDRADPFGGPQQQHRLSQHLSFPTTTGRETRPLPDFGDPLVPSRSPQAAPTRPMSSLSSLEQDFRELLSNWPALPRLEESPSAAISRGSPVEISAEQVIGTWSA